MSGGEADRLATGVSRTYEVTEMRSNPNRWLMALACVASPCGAQAPGRFTPTPVIVTQRDLSDAMSGCLLARNRAAAIALAAATDEAAEKSARNRIHADMVACLRGRPSATLNGMYLKSGIAERLLTERDSALLANAATLPPVAAVRVKAGERAGLEALACAVRVDPVDATAMLRARPATEEEAAAFRKLGPALQACVPADGTVSIKPYIIRATVAIETFQAIHHRTTVGRIDGGNGKINA